MKASQDAYGESMFACYRGYREQQIIERDDGFVNVLGAIGYLSAYEEWFSQEQEAMSLVEGRVLDVGCGAGRHSLYLQENGHEVVGIDVSPRAVEVCKLRGVKDVRTMSITQVSARKLGIFDTIVMLGSNFGLFGSRERARWLLRRFYRMTSEAGRIIGETRDPYQTAEPAHQAYHALNRKRGRMSGQARIRVRYKTMKSPWEDYLFVSKDEMRDLLEDTGWGIAQFVDSNGAGYHAVIEKVG